MNNSYLEELHKVQVEILKEVDRVCTKNKLEYYLVGGTLLGAIRHKGFIPWDDDIDIAMPRDDYEKLVTIWESEFKGKYYLQCSENDEKYWSSIAKIRKKNTIYDEEACTEINTSKGIFIDIFPLDEAKYQDCLVQKIQSILTRIISTIIFVRCGADKKRFSKKTLLLSKLTKLVSIKSLANFRDAIMKLNKNKTSKYYINLGSRYNYVKQTILKEMYNPPKKVEFEGELFNAPNSYDYVLKRIYGNDYMELPPEEKRVNHSPLKIIFNTEESNEKI